MKNTKTKLFFERNFSLLCFVLFLAALLTFPQLSSGQTLQEKVDEYIGALLKMEEQHASPKEIAHFSANTMGILAAFGDPFFRSALPIFASVTSCLAAMFGGVLAGIVTLLLLFNAVHFAVRFGGITIGYREGREVVPRVARWLSPRRTQNIKRISATAICDDWSHEFRYVCTIVSRSSSYQFCPPVLGKFRNRTASKTTE